MPANVEIKALLRNRPGVEAAVRRLSTAGPELIQQEDVFFRCDAARLKLRMLDPTRGELIRYQRDNLAEARCSHYTIARTSDPHILRDMLAATLGVTGVVVKTRTLYVIDQTRVHPEHVQGLGAYLELEVVLRPGQTEAEGKRIAEVLLKEFGIEKPELIGEAYADLLFANRQVT